MDINNESKYLKVSGGIVYESDQHETGLGNVNGSNTIVSDSLSIQAREFGNTSRVVSGSQALHFFDNHENNTAENSLYIINFCVIVLAMTTFANLGYVMTAEQLDGKLDDGFLYVLAIVVWVATFFAKGAVVLYFSNQGLKAAIEKNSLDLLGCCGDSVRNNFKKAAFMFSAVVCAVFWAYLADLAFKECNQLTKGKDGVIYDMFSSEALKYLVIVCSLISNLSAWYNVQQCGVPVFKNLLGDLYSLFTDHSNFVKNKKTKIALLKEYKELYNTLIHHLKNSNPKNSNPINKDCLLDGQIPLPLIGFANVLKLNRLPHSNAMYTIFDFCAKKDDDSDSDHAKYIFDKMLNYFNQTGKISNISSISYMRAMFSEYVALACLIIAIIGFSNVLHLSDVIWGNLGAKEISEYGVSYVNYFSLFLSLLITVYIPVRSLLDSFMTSFNKNLLTGFETFVIAIFVVMIGVLGGLANGEQSVLANQEILTTIFAILASGAVDAFVIPTMLNQYFENKKIKKISKEDNSLPFAPKIVSALSTLRSVEQLVYGMTYDKYICDGALQIDAPHDETKIESNISDKIVRDKIDGDIEGDIEGGTASCFTKCFTQCFNFFKKSDNKPLYNVQLGQYGNNNYNTL